MPPRGWTDPGCAGDRVWQTASSPILHEAGSVFSARRPRRELHPSTLTARVDVGANEPLVDFCPRWEPNTRSYPEVWAGMPPEEPEGCGRRARSRADFAVGPVGQGVGLLLVFVQQGHNVPDQGLRPVRGLWFLRNNDGRPIADHALEDVLAFTLQLETMRRARKERAPAPVDSPGLRTSRRLRERQTDDSHSEVVGIGPALDRRLWLPIRSWLEHWYNRRSRPIREDIEGQGSNRRPDCSPNTLGQLSRY